MTTQQDTKFKIELMTGAEVELFYFDFALNYGFVLARWRNEWVTWRVYPSNREPGKFECETGHYFRDAEHPNSKQPAYADFKKRAQYAS